MVDLAKKGAKAISGERTSGGPIDIYKAIGKLPRPKGWLTLPEHKYTGPYNPLGEQLEYDPESGKILKYHVKPHNQIDEIIAMMCVMYGKVEK